MIWFCSQPFTKKICFSYTKYIIVFIGGIGILGKAKNRNRHKQDYSMIILRLYKPRQKIMNLRNSECSFGTQHSSTRCSSWLFSCTNFPIFLYLKYLQVYGFLKIQSDGPKLLNVLFICYIVEVGENIHIHIIRNIQNVAKFCMSYTGHSLTESPSTGIQSHMSVYYIYTPNSENVLYAIQGGPKRTERHTSGNKDIKWLVSVDGLSSPEKKWYQDQPFWLSGSYSRARYVSQCRLQNFPFSGKTSPKKHGTIDFFLGICSDQQLSFSPCSIEHLFFIIITPRSSNLVENFLFYE